MSWVSEMFDEAEKRDKLETKRLRAFEELAPTYIANLKRSIHAAVDEFNSRLAASGRPQKVQCSDTSNGVELTFGQLPVYSIRLSTDTETLAASENDDRKREFRLEVTGNLTELVARGIPGPAWQRGDEVRELLMPFLSAAQAAR